jgi:hypothetical protein
VVTPPRLPQREQRVGGIGVDQLAALGLVSIAPLVTVTQVDYVHLAGIRIQHVHVLGTGLAHGFPRLWISPLDSLHGGVYITYMDTKDWTEKQRKAYEALKASVSATQSSRQVGFSNGTPKGGWTDIDRIQK